MLMVFVILYLAVFTVLSVVYYYFVNEGYHDVVENLHRPTVNAERLVYFVILTKFKNYIILPIIALIPLVCRIYDLKFRRELWWAYVCFFILVIVLYNIFPHMRYL